MSFKDQLKTDSLNVFLNADEFAETITYTPKGAAGKSIKAQVFRKRLDPAGEDAGRVLLNQTEIMIANDATYGVTAINKGGDAVSLPERVGGGNINWIVADVLAQDEGMWHLLLER